MSFRPDERFAIIPEWVLNLGLTDKAIRLYCVLALYADFTEGVCNPGRKKLAARCACSVDTVDRAKKELVDADVISVSPNTASAGDPTSNIYTVHRIPPGSRTGAAPPHESGDGGGTGAATKLNENQVNERSSRSWPPKTIDGRELTEQEVALAERTLSTFNETFGKNFRGMTHLTAIVKRHREHPEADLEALVEKASGNRWWERRSASDFSPNVIFGNANIFERTLNFEPEADGGGPDLSRYDR